MKWKRLMVERSQEITVCTVLNYNDKFATIFGFTKTLCRKHTKNGGFWTSCRKLDWSPWERNGFANLFAQYLYVRCIVRTGLRQCCSMYYRDQRLARVLACNPSSGRATQKQDVNVSERSAVALLDRKCRADDVTVAATASSITHTSSPQSDSITIRKPSVFCAVNSPSPSADLRNSYLKKTLQPKVNFSSQGIFLEYTLCLLYSIWCL